MERGALAQRAGYRMRLIGWGYELQRPRRSSVDGVDLIEFSLEAESVRFRSYIAHEP